jgi:LPS sulfotransferase NodH
MIVEINKTPRNHQSAIHSHFEGNVHFTETAPIFNFPLCLLAFTNRSGSNLLAEYLQATGYFCGFQEPLNSDVVCHVSQLRNIQNFPDYIEHITRNQLKPGKSFFMKSSWDQFLMLREWGILNMFSGLKIVYIERLNYIDQAISYIIAHQTKQWTVFHEKKSEEIHYDHKTIDDVISANSKANRIFRYIFELLNLNYVHVAYEELVKDPLANTAKVLQFFGQSSAPDLSNYQPRLKAQANSLNRKFKQRYIAESAVSLDLRGRSFRDQLSEVSETDNEAI